MVKTFVLLFLIIFIGCQKVNKTKAIEIENINLNLKSEWVYVKKIKSPIPKDKVIMQPLGALVLVMELHLPKENSGLMINQCLFYRVPYKEIEGEILIEEKSDDQSCSIQPTEKIKYQITNVKNFKINLIDHKMFWDFEFELKKYKFEFFLVNLEGERKYNEYEPLIKKSFLPLMTFVNSEESGRLYRTLGKFDDRYSQNTAINCLKVNEKCEVIGENKCDFCKFGHYEVIKENCLIGPRFCGVNHCGQKDEPACIRGRKSMLDELDGICNGNLEPFLDEKKVLICH